MASNSDARPAGTVSGAAVTDSFKHCGAILVVDDEDMVRDAFAVMLEELGFEALKAASGEEALRIFVELGDSIKLVLLDHHMPRMDGETVLRELRRIRPDVRVLLASGYNELDIAGRYDGSAMNFIQKPFTMDRLMIRIQQTLQA